MTKTICIIPARKGSKRLPGKNMKLLNGNNLIHYTMRVALHSDFIDEIVILTNIKALHKRYDPDPNFTVIHEPEELAGDNTEAWELVKYVAECLKQQLKNPTIIYLQPTSPLRSDYDLYLAWTMYNLLEIPIASITYVDKWNYKLNGAIYISDYRHIMANESLWKKVNYFYKMPKERSVNIDTIEDWQEAERILNG